MPGLLSWLAFVLAAPPAGGPRLVVAPVAPLVGAGGQAAAAAQVASVEAALEAACKRLPFSRVAWRSTGEPTPASVPADIAATLAQAADAMRSLEVNRAVQLLNKAITDLEARLVEVGSVDALAKARLELAGHYLTLNEASFAHSELTRVVRLKPGLELDPRLFPPPLVAAAAEARRTVLAEPQGQLRVDGLTGASVRLNDRVLGEVPLTVSVPKGLHLLVVTAAGHRTLASAIQITAGGVTQVQAALVPHKAFSLAGQLLAEVGGADRRVEGMTLARALARESGADLALVVGVAPIPGGYAVVGSLTSEPAQAVVGVVDVALTDLEPLLSGMVKRLLERAANSVTTPVELLRLPSTTVTFGGVALDFERHLLGVVPQVPPTTTPMLAAGTTGVPAPDVSMRAEPTTSLWRSPWLWISVAVVVAGATGAGIWLATGGESPPPEYRTRLHVEAR